MTARPSALREVLLVILFRAPERGGGNDLGDNRSAEPAGFLKPRLERLGLGFLLVVVIEDSGAVLVADVRSLAVQGCRIMVRPEDFQQSRIGRDGGVELDFDDFGVAGVMGADRFVGGVRGLAAFIADGGRHDTGNLPEGFLDAPETARAEGRFLGHACLLRRAAQARRHDWDGELPSFWRFGRRRQEAPWTRRAPRHHWERRDGSLQAGVFGLRTANPRSGGIEANRIDADSLPRIASREVPLSTTLSPSIKKVAILFAGGPAPAANAVISTAAVSFLRNDIEVLGIRHGYSHLVDYSPERPLTLERDYIQLDHRRLRRTRNSRGIIIGTARANPGKNVNSPADLADPAKTAPLRSVYDALISLGVDALVSIGGDDTLKTANKFKLFQEHLPAGSKRIAVVHVPKTIDNDYKGIDFTFGYFSAVETLAGEIRNLLADAEAVQGYYLVETMGRSAGWLAYGAAIAGEASLVMSVEDIIGEFRLEETTTDPKSGESKTRPVMDMDKVVGRIVKAMIARGRREGFRRDRDGRRDGRTAPGTLPRRHPARRTRPHRDRPGELRPAVRATDRRRVQEAYR